MHKTAELRYLAPSTEDDFPSNIKSKVCFPDRCGGGDGRNTDGYTIPDVGSNLISFCRNCKRPGHWCTYRCVNCDVVFIKDFIDPKFCSLLPHCWDCLPRLQWAFCDAHASTSFRAYGSFRKEPKGLNPKIYSTAELDDILGDDFFGPGE